ncbi:MAG TPA: hypothetical protein PKA88_10515, partial [Polyangiaceae bacterium]|nr:hypothetical protein [Polyangiaceae bacterium]
RVPGQLSAVGSTLTWTPAGPLVEPKLTLRSRDGKTTIHYIETLANAGQQWLGFGTLAAFGGMFSGLGGSLLFAFLAMSMGFSKAAAGPYVLAAGGVVGVAMAVVTFLGLQRLLAKRADSRGAFADEVLISVARAARAQLDRRPVKTRVDTATHAPDIEGEAAAEEALAAVEALEAEAARLGEAKE